MSDLAIRVENVSKCYRIGRVRGYRTLRENFSELPLISTVCRLFGGAAREQQDEEFWALRDVSFEVKAGEVIGVIGRNGAGKSTLLKILSRITKPTTGVIEINGRVGSLLEVGTGFHPELTGRENVFMNGALLGMRKSEIVRRFDEIVAFAEVEKFIDTPVKRYSSGMYVRLAFAVAAHLEPEILIVDEVLSVGDISFQQKCLGKVRDVSTGGRTVLFVSHNMAAVENLCQKIVMLQHGSVVFAGDCHQGIERYVQSVSGGGSGLSSNVIDLTQGVTRRPEYVARPLLRRLELFTNDDKPLNSALPMGGQFRARVHFHLPKPTDNFQVGLAFESMHGQRLFSPNTLFEPGLTYQREREGDVLLECDIPTLPLVPGEYLMKMFLTVNNQDVDAVEDAIRLTVVESDYFGTGKTPGSGIFVLPHRWRVLEADNIQSGRDAERAVSCESFS